MIWNEPHAQTRTNTIWKCLYKYCIRTNIVVYKQHCVDPINYIIWKQHAIKLVYIPTNLIRILFHVCICMIIHHAWPVTWQNVSLLIRFCLNWYTSSNRYRQILIYYINQIPGCCCTKWNTVLISTTAASYSFLCILHCVVNLICIYHFEYNKYEYSAAYCPVFPYPMAMYSYSTHADQRELSKHTALMKTATLTRNILDDFYRFLVSYSVNLKNRF